jgi:T5SS/PEP-CTERM-associated repeat protein
LTTGPAIISNTPGSIGNVRVAGAGSKWAISNILAVGNNGNGNLTVEDGGIVTTTTTVQIGSLATASSGMLRVSGNGSLFSTPGDIQVGSTGSGDVELDDGGDLAGGFLFAGNTANSVGNIIMRDAGTSATINSNVAIGNVGTGFLTLESGARFSANSFINIGSSNTARGTVSVAGAGSRMTAGLAIGVGVLGDGVLDIGAGGTVSTPGSGSITIGQSPGSSGEVTISGAGASMSAGAIFLGGTFSSGGGPSVLTIGPGASVTSNTTMLIWNPSTLHMTGGVLNVPAGINSSGAILLDDGRINATGNQVNVFGDLRLGSPNATITANFVSLVSGSIRGTGQINAALSQSSNTDVTVEAGDHLRFGTVAAPSSISGRVTLVDGGQVDFTNNNVTFTNTGRLSGHGTFRAANINNSGTFALSGGISDIYGTLTNQSSARLFVTGNSVASFYNPVTNNPGCIFQISAGSTAVFFGNVTGLGAFTGTGIKDFQGGVSTVGQLNTGGDTVVGGPAVVTTDSLREHGLVLSGRVTIPLNGGPTATSRLIVLDIEGGVAPVGTFDLADNDLVIDYSIVEPDDVSPLPVHQAQIVAARHGGAWDRPGITSTAAASQASHATTLGIMEGSDFHQIYGSGAPFSGQTIDDTTVLVKYTWYGDSDFNGRVNFDDYVRIDQGFNNHLTGWINGDFDLNGTINFDDYVLIDLAFNTQSGTLRRALSFLDGLDRSTSGMGDPALRSIQQHFLVFGQAYARGFVASVPEPHATLMVAVAVGAGALARRRRAQR